MGGNNLEIACGPLDQRPVETRHDVLVFTSAVLTDVLPLTGPLNVMLSVSSNCTDTDFTVKLTDVHPTGVSRLIQDGIIRMRWRNRYESDQPQLMTPGTVYNVEVSLWNTSYIFNPGHRLRVDISSSNQPRFSINPNNGEPLSKNGTGPILVAQNTVYHSANYPSAIILPVVTMAQLPPFHVVSAIPKEYAEPLMEHYKAETFEQLEEVLVDVFLMRDPIVHAQWVQHQTTRRAVGGQ
jgi:putative CocE/NonD family hydrolase